jgi:formate hydrogenlyase subunit 6/NADH:ubiquinone oxidoreductase subunit I
MSPLKNLSFIRKLVQVAAFIFFIWGGAIVGYYTVDKVSVALPALSCAFNHETADYCVLIPLQHQMAHRLGEVVASGGAIMQGLMPILITLGTFLLLFVFLNKAFCGWLCPLGTFQEFLRIIGQKLGLQGYESVDEKIVQRTRPVKWLILVFLVLFFPLLTGLGYMSHDLVDPYCKICPSRILTTLVTGETGELVVDNSSPINMGLSMLADFLFGLMVALALTVRQPFCRICPMLAMQAVFKKLGLLRLVKNASSRCEKCGLCAKACPMDIREIHTEMVKKDVTYPDCTLCGRCVEFCPDEKVLQLKYAGLPVFSASPAYFKARKKAQTEWENGKRPAAKNKPEAQPQ